MKVETQTIGPCRVKLIIKADATEIHEDYEIVMQRYLREAQVRGFRPGKAPRAVIEREYHREIDSDIRQRLVSVFARRAVDEEKLALVSMVDVSDILLSSETGISFDLVCDVAPEFKLPKYQKIPLKMIDPTVSDEAVEERIALIRRHVSQYEDGAADGTVAKDDVARIDFTAVSDGKPLKELAESAALYSEGTGFWLQVSEPEMIPGVALALVGMKIGDEKEIKTKFPKDFKVAELQGVKATYQVKLVGFRQLVLATDAEMCEQMKVAEFDDLRSTIQQSLQQQAEAEEKNRREQEVIGYLLKKTDFELPESEVAEQTGHTVRSMLRDVVNRGGTREDLEKNRDELLATATTSTKNRLRLRYILTRIAEEAGITTSDAEVDQKIEEFAAQSQMTPEKIRERIETQYEMENLRVDIRVEKTLAFLIESAKG